jgi:hypothetical protein
MAGAIGQGEIEMRFIAIAATLVFLLWGAPAMAGPCADFDADGVCDIADNCINPAPATAGLTAMVNPGQEDTDGDDCGNVCDGDFNQSGGVDLFDIFVLIPNLAPAPPNPMVDTTNPIGDNITLFDIFALLPWLSGPPAALPAGPSGTTAGTLACP